jgi:hypothetical protein
LKVAFRFHRKGKAAWNCDDCRSGGLETKRNCGFLRPKGPVPKVPVWAQGDLWLEECPKPYISAESMGTIESYLVWKKFGGNPVETRPAKEVDGFLILDAEIAEEERRLWPHSRF